MRLLYFLYLNNQVVGKMNIMDYNNSCFLYEIYDLSQNELI